MGCSQSKIENEEAIARCKERKVFMKDAVTARNGFAAAHSAYAMSLKNTGAALSDYAHGELQVGPAQSNPLAFDLPPPPPPMPDFPASSLQRAVSMPEIKISKPDSKSNLVEPIIEEEDENESSVGGLRRRRSSRGGGSSRRGNRELAEEEEDPPPPLPPSPSRTPPPEEIRPVLLPQQQDPTYDFFFSMENIPGPTLGEVNFSEEEIESKAFDSKRMDVDVTQDTRESQMAQEAAPVTEKVMEPPTQPASGPTGKNSKKMKQVAVAIPAENKRIVKANALQLFEELDDHFLKASESAHEVSKMLEATRLHYHSNFADNRGHIDHSARVMRVITWNRSFRGIPPNVGDGKDGSDVEEQETHATVLDKLLAWDKKLYDEVKAGELLKFEYQKKVAALNKLKKRGSNSEALEKVKAAVSHLHTRYIVDMQSIDSTVSEINRLRDKKLYPKLVQLVDGMATMWETMEVHHDSQYNIALVLRSLDLSQSPKETIEHHHERTIQLFAVVQEWHLQFEKLVNRKKDYIKALNSWLKLNLIPIESNLKEKVSSPPRVENPPIKKLLHAWHDHLEKLQDGLLRSAISTFAALINTIFHLQEDEMKLKSKCEETRKELAKKTRHFEDWYNKYMERRASEEEADPESAEESTHKNVIAEKQYLVDTLRNRLKEEEEAYQRHCLYVRDKSFATLKTHLPELFHKLKSFALASSEMYIDLRSIAESQNANKNPG